ncbi:7,8-didemethyl-8-hydroxy-5-deazariboflavin synthase subunit CofG [Methanobrevibacter curvatus]|uniref:7,8-didemethyl-8-hydroxy-5-deazariboflavin synthase n=1 Tax=Methanobrevibacter curvatus TaxID=49547 RepID=A0A166DH61_9EURY|nr:7,8-didemethyl-8-hydroxy-5-deazariboflavin synthase subunit CofG [Methanobrevibacter curvatus]KZX15599.1 FO synthase subunit 1 [Methanobrevibacter curvatus]
MTNIEDTFRVEDEKYSKEDLVNLLNCKNNDVNKLMSFANSKRENNIITYSKNVFIPLTEICRNSCGYCTFKKEATDSNAILLKKKDEVIETLKIAEKYGCKEALLTFGEQADENTIVKKELEKQGFSNMIEYLYDICEDILDKTNLLPHSNCGVLSYKDLKILKDVNASMGMMLENSSPRLMKTVAHENSPGKDPKLRLNVLKNTGKLKIPYTTGILIGIGEKKEEIAKSLLDIKKCQNKHGNIQEIIIQNFKTKPGILMENFREPSLLDMIRTVSVAKILFPNLSIQVPPNLNQETNQIFLFCGADDWGGVSPLTKDYVNPEAKWPAIEDLEYLTRESGFELQERLAIYNKYIKKDFLSERILNKVLNLKNSLDK